ncbi:MAG: rhomboid family intramembrane serine protease [Flavobacteriales bacterium]|nr:rhomboid family intramembrane serine protease [Flavobacteriales bacterium]
MNFSPTLILIVVNVIVSLMCFEKRDLFYKLALNPYSVKHNKEWYRLFTHAFVHADFMHLFVNMYVLYGFGQFLEQIFMFHFGDRGLFLYILLYFGAMIFATPVALKRHQDNPSYNSVGASGAVAGIIFSFIAFYPGQILELFFILPIPAFIFGALYLIYEAVMDKRGRGNVAHDAHFFGAVFGFGFTVLLDTDIFLNFFKQVLQFFGI